jgi:plastocyanin
MSLSKTGRAWVAAATLALVPAAGLALRAAAQPAAVTVKIDNFTFDPPTITVAAGTTVTWVNDDDTPHTVAASDGKSFRSKALDSEDRFAFKFSTPGTYPYFCSIHPHMTGRVIVRPS